MKSRKIEIQKDRNIERQKYRKIEIQRDRNIERQKYRKVDPCNVLYGSL